MGLKTKHPHTRVWPNHYMRDPQITPQLIEQLNKLMTSMGYDVDSDIPIWQQFHIRHGLSIEE